MQFSMRAVLEKEYGDKQTRELLKTAGRVAGHEFCRNMLDTSLPLNKFVAQLHDVLLEMSVGILRLEKADVDNLNFIATVSEDLDCSGLPIKGATVCDFDEGLIEGIFTEYTGRPFEVKETDCWSTGERTCRFSINLRK
jgi:predicted hydrocarbon binding protein